ncbi:MAG: hypothetical protein J3Q66DRAFT_345131, partial [Benniella sp.]
LIMFTPSLLFRLLFLLHDVPGRPCAIDYGQGRSTLACWWTIASATDHPPVLLAQLNGPQGCLLDRERRVVVLDGSECGDASRTL